MKTIQILVAVLLAGFCTLAVAQRDDVVLLTFGTFMWLVFGIMLKESPIIVANAITMMLAATILFYKLRFK